MRALFATGSPANYMRPPVLAEEQIQCGPDWSDQCNADGQVASLATEVGEYDLGAVVRRLGENQKPDVLVCLVDASWRNLPRNLAAFGCPRVLLVADTHHMNAPIERMIRYAASEPYDRVVLLYDRHHLEFFRHADIKNLFWFPGLTFPHSDDAVKAARNENRQATLAFVGQTGKFHPRRTRILDSLVEAGLPLDRKGLAQDQALQHYGSAAMGINVSLNGDLNLRVFEILAAGGALVTDRLSRESGLDDLFKEGREVITYGNSDELAERAKYYLSNLQEAHSVGKQGAAWFDTKFSEKRRLQRFLSLAMDGVQPEEFPLPRVRTNAYLPGDVGVAQKAVKVYELVQELHRLKEQVFVGLDKHSQGFRPMLSTLPRMRLVDASEPADLSVMSSATVEEANGAKYVWCWDAGASEVGQVVSPWVNYIVTDATLGLLRHQAHGQDHQSDPREATQSAKNPDHQIAVGVEAMERGEPELAIACGQGVLAGVPEHPGARRLMGQALLAKGQATEALPFLLGALPQFPLDADLWFCLARALLATDQVGDAFLALRKSVEIDDRNVDAWLLLGAMARECGKWALTRKIAETVRTLAPGDARVAALVEREAEAESRFLKQQLTEAMGYLSARESKSAQALLESADRLFPEQTQVLLLLGHALKQQGRVQEGLELHRKAVRAKACLHRGPGLRRIAFLVQHPPVWSSTSTVIEAFQRDPQWETTIIAAPYLHPYSTPDEQQSIFGFLDRHGIVYTRWDSIKIEPDFVDVLFLQNPYDVTRPASLRVGELLRYVQRLAYVPYGIEIGGGSQNYDYQFNLPLQQLAWLICARSARHRDMIARHCLAGGAHVEITGHPKMDALLRVGPARADNPILLRAEGRRVVCWNPQFDVRPDGKGFSTFDRYSEAIPAAIAKYENLLLVVRPHPLLFGTLIKRGLWNESRVIQWKERMESAKNVMIDAESSYLPAFQASQAMLSDASSFVLEYSATGKPLLYLDNAAGPGLNDDGEFVRDFCYTAECEEDVDAFLAMVAGGEDPKKRTRQKAFPTFMFVPEEGVGARIKRTVEERLTLEI